MGSGDWILTATGAVVRVERENIDKSGKNPRFLLRIVLAPESVDAPPEARLSVELVLQIQDRDLAKLGPEPKPGARIKVKARGNGPSPATFYLTAIESL